jgi:16S rRNA (guanine966-N2)-methyltransferase
VRIIGGRWRGRQIAAPATDAVRPTGDRVREAWFSILQFDLPGARVVDLCAGSGALGIEALSRGASHVTFVDNAPRSLDAIRRNLTTLGADASSYTLHRADVLPFVRDLPADAFTLGFADPPYASGIAAQLAEAWRSVRFASVLSVEHPDAVRLGDGGDRRRYGLTAITFFRD